MNRQSQETTHSSQLDLSSEATNFIPLEYNAWSEIIGSTSWAVFIKMMKAHKSFLQTEVNRFVKSQNLIAAYAAVEKMDDVDKIIQLVSRRVDELRKGGSKDGR